MTSRWKTICLAALLLAVVGASMPAPAPALADPGPQKPVLAFYYPWYRSNDWTSGKMSDLPASPYVSDDAATIKRHIAEATGAGLDGFISSWWGPGDRTDVNFDTLLNLSEGQNFHSTIYFEVNSWLFGSQDKIVSALNYARDKYAGRAGFLRYNDRPVIFFWDVKSVPRAGGQSPQAAWASIRQQVDPNRSMIWSAETTDLSYLDVFDGIHLFSAATWSSNLSATDKGFRAKLDSYNVEHRTSKIWAAGVAPGYDDTRLGRSGSYAVPRRDGAYYQDSFNAAIGSSPEWITITSFNEWFEGSQIEPSRSYGNKYLDLTRQLVASYKSGPADPPNPALYRTWNRTDGPVAGRAVNRTWMWGPAAFAASQEPYQDCAGGSRSVQYYDKSRMEINDPNGDQNNPWFVTNGLLVSEMINGRVQVGNNAYQLASPAQVGVAGDANDTSGPTYATLGGLQGAPARPAGQAIQEMVDRSGRVWTDTSMPAVHTAYVTPETGRAVADVFWDFLNSSGLVYEGRAVTGRLFDPVFYATGLPITEAYWTRVNVNGQPREVLVQAFERRVLTYTPSNPEGWKVEMGNVGRHYHMWRYGN